LYILKNHEKKIICTYLKYSSYIHYHSRKSKTKFHACIIQKGTKKIKFHAFSFKLKFIFNQISCIQTCNFIQIKFHIQSKNSCIHKYIIRKKKKKSNFMHSNMHFQNPHSSKVSCIRMHSSKRTKSKIHIQANFRHSSMHFSFKKFTKFHAFINAF